jgi:hypothetical protein
MAIDMFDTRTMLAMLDEGKPAHTFLRDRYFADVRTFDTKKVDIDLYKGKRRLAPFVHPKIGGQTVDRTGYRTESYEPPETSPDMITTAEDLLKRGPGENIYGASDPNTRAAEQLGRDLAELDNMISRREEWMAAQALFTGKIDVKGEGYDEVIQYWPADAQDQPYLALGAGERWNEGTSTPLEDFRAARRNVIQGSGVNPVDAILGTDAIEALLKNTSFSSRLDNRRIDMGAIDPSNLPNGVTYWGYLKDSGLDLWSYDEWYLDDNGVEQPMVPGKLVLIGSPNVRTTMMYGCVVDVDKGSFALPRVPVSWTQRKNPAGRIVQVKSKPLPVIHQIDGFRVLKVLN